MRRPPARLETGPISNSCPAFQVALADDAPNFSELLTVCLPEAKLKALVRSNISITI
jgi:hypothetical protein